MAQINIPFNNKEYLVDESALSASKVALQNHLSTVMSGSGATINFGGTSYGIDSVKLTAATNAFTAHLGTISGSGAKVVVGGVEYGIDSTKVAGSVAEIETVLGGLSNGGGSDEPELTLVESWDISATSGSGNVMAYLYNDPVNEGKYTLSIEGSGQMKNWGWNDITDFHHSDYQANITSVTINEGVTNIGEWAFNKFTSLTSIVIPNSITVIGDCSFDNCSSLTD